jgi:type II secretory pathway pseudopilin PulG
MMVVLVLISLAVGMTVVGFDGFTQRARLRSSLAQVASVHALARTQALCDGRPRLLQFDTDRCVVRHPEPTSNRWEWSSGIPFIVGRGVSIQEVVTEDGVGGDTRLPTIRVGSDGTSGPYAVVVVAGEATGAVVIDGITGRGRCVLQGADGSLDPSALLSEEEE